MPKATVGTTFFHGATAHFGRLSVECGIASAASMLPDHSMFVHVAVAT